MGERYMGNKYSTVIADTELEHRQGPVNH